MVRNLPHMKRMELQRLKRPALQEIAKREGVKASGKNATIINLLIAKYPDGVPSHQGRSQSRKSPTVKDEDHEPGSSTPLKRQSKRQKVDPRSPVNPSLQEWVPTVTPSVSGWVQATADADPPLVEPLVPRRVSSPPPVPTMKDVRHVKRETTRLVNDMPCIRSELVETRALLEHATSMLRNVSEDFKEMSKVQHVLERDLVENYETDRRLWDGTHLMSDGDFEQWDSFLQGLQVENEERKRLEEQRLEAEYQELQRRAEEAKDDDDDDDDDDDGVLASLSSESERERGQKRKRSDLDENKV